MPDGGTSDDPMSDCASALSAIWAGDQTCASLDPSGWQSVQAIWRYLAAQDADDPASTYRAGPVWAACLLAGARYQRVIAAAWGRIGDAFAVQRRALGDAEARLLRERWYAVAEAEFIQTLRSEQFLDAQRNLIRALLVWNQSLPCGTREGLRLTRRAVATVQRHLGELPLDQVRIAQTPTETVWSMGVVSLRRYSALAPQHPSRGAMLIVHGLIGRQTMTDLLADRSMVRQLLAAGVDVFALDWGNAGPEDAGKGLDHYAGTVLGNALSATRAASGNRLTLMGICQGGTLAACHMAVHGGADGLITAVSPFDFHADIEDADPAHGLLHLWLRSLEDKDIDSLIGLDGNLSGTLMGLIFAQLNPIRTLAKYTTGLAEIVPDKRALEVFLAMEKWLADRPDLPGELARTWLVDLYRHNRLVTGEVRLQGRPVELPAIRAPVLNVYAASDHITPPPCTRALCRFIAPARYRELSLPAGHIGAFVGSASQPLLAPGILRWLDETNRHTAN